MDHEYNMINPQQTVHINQPTDPVLTVEDVTAYFKFRPDTIRSMARWGELLGLKIGKVWRF
jgi:hypothetical protein